MKGSKLERIAELRELNYSYQFIADKLGMPMNTVKSLCRRNGIQAIGPRKTKSEKRMVVLCKNCLRPMSPKKRMDSIFCSDYCRTAWRRKNRRVSEK